MKSNFTSTALLLSLATLLFSCKDSDSTAPSFVQFSINQVVNESGRISEDDPTALVVSIENESGDLIYENETIALTSLGDTYIADPLLLEIGNYSLVKFLVINGDDEIVYATPVRGSSLASLVDFPLPIDFQIQADDVTSLFVEVISTDSVDPEDLGYTSIGFTIKPTFNILTSVFALNSETASYEFIESNVTIYNGVDSLRSVDLGDSINVIKLRSDIVNYTMIFSAEGLTDRSIEISSDSLTYYAVTPLQIIMDNRPPTITLSVSKDAMIRELGGTGDGINYGDYEFLSMHAWTNSGTAVTHRSLLDFDLSQIPEGATITGAQLNLYSDNNASGMFSGGHQKLSGSNESVISRVTSSWEESAVTWDSQPSTTDTFETILSESESNFQSYQIDVTQLVNDMIENQASSFGFMIRLTDESYYRRMVFASSDNVNSAIHPTLELTLSY